MTMMTDAQWSHRLPAGEPIRAIMTPSGTLMSVPKALVIRTPLVVYSRFWNIIEREVILCEDSSVPLSEDANGNNNECSLQKMWWRQRLRMSKDDEGRDYACPQKWIKHFEHWRSCGSAWHDSDVSLMHILVSLTFSLQKPTDGIDPGKLVLTDVTYEDSGWYTCLVGNYFGVIHRSAWLEVIPGRSWLPHL
jgi:hypothetical protein